MDDSNSFRIIPETQDVEKMDRDLRFFPADAARCRTLTTEQVDGFNRVGYISPVAVFSADEIMVLRDYFDRLLAQVLAAGDDSYSISTAHMKHGRVYDLLTDVRIVDAVQDLLGDDVVAWGSHFFCKMPGDGKRVAWHQDASYWPLSPSKTVTVWLAIDDADVENGCMKFLRGSHHEGHMNHRPSLPEEHNVLDQTVEDVERYGEPVNNVLAAGQISLHSDLLLHGSEANDSDRRRCGLTLRYCSADVRAAMDWNQKGVVVRGADSSGHWANPPSPR